MTTKWVYRCATCQSTNIEITAWVEPNDGMRLVDDDGPLDECWCRECGDWSAYTLTKGDGK